MKMFFAVRQLAVVLPLLMLVGGGSGWVSTVRASGVTTVVPTPPKDGDGSPDPGNGNTQTGSTTMVGGGSSGAGGNAGGSATITASGGSLTVNTGASYSAGLTLSGATVTLGGANYYSGSTVVNAGTLNTIGALGLGSAGASFTGGTIVTNGDGTYTLTGVNVGSGETTDTSGGTTGAASGGTYSLHGDSLTGGKTPKLPALSGNAGKLKVGTTADGSQIHVKTIAAVTNTGTKTAKGVTATVYLSDDAVLDAADTKVATLALADFLPASKGKIDKGETVSLPIKHKVPAALADALEGKYLIVVLSATNGTPGDAANGTTAEVNGDDAVINPGTGYNTVEVTGTTTGSVTGILWMESGDTFFVTDGGTLTDSMGGKWSVLPGGRLSPVAGGGVLLQQGNTATTVAASQLTLSTGQTVALGMLTNSTTATPVVTGGTTSTTAVMPTNEIIVGPIDLP